MDNVSSCINNKLGLKRKTYVIIILVYIFQRTSFNQMKVKLCRDVKYTFKYLSKLLSSSRLSIFAMKIFIRNWNKAFCMRVRNVQCSTTLHSESEMGSYCESSISEYATSSSFIKASLVLHLDVETAIAFLSSQLPSRISLKS